MKVLPMNTRIKNAMRRTWDIIADDVLAISPKGRCRRDVVIEMVIDADRLGQYGDDDEAYVASKTMSYEKLCELGRGAFADVMYD